MLDAMPMRLSMICAGLLSVVLFPVVALALLRTSQRVSAAAD